ncbi:NAD(P)-dependent oxidoreductase, partial [Candidatus Roizmanbacteria bacterium]|nr:NAD(P)-dependent oxidoreductase [Candidatus Roizmanbacteria bacterium]
MTILGTGLSGMVGSCIQETLRDRYVFEDLSTESGVDVRDFDHVLARIQKSSSEVVLHLAAKTDVDGCEKDKLEDSERRGAKDPNDFTIDWKQWRTVSSAYAINVVGTLNIARACKEVHKRMIYVSTDFVFDGRENKTYTENDEPNPLSYYAQTKWWGEQVVRSMLSDYIIARFAFPYGTHHPVKKDFIRTIYERLESRQEVSIVSDQIITPSFAPDLARAIDHLISHAVHSQTFHLVGSDSLSPYEIAVAIARSFGYDTQIIKKTTAQEYYQNRAPRPQFLRVSNEKIRKRG